MLILGIGDDTAVKYYTWTPQTCPNHVRYEKEGFGFFDFQIAEASLFHLKTSETILCGANEDIKTSKAEN